VSETDEMSITLTHSQVAQIVRGGSRSTSVLRSLNDLASAAALIDSTLDSKQISRSTLRALLVFAAFPANGTYRSLTEVANEIGYNPSTTHRYASTWLAIGLLEQDPSSRRYRRAS
jgi:IclR helix-turn-helix domain